MPPPGAPPEVPLLKPRSWKEAAGKRVQLTGLVSFPPNFVNSPPIRAILILPPIHVNLPPIRAILPPVRTISDLIRLDPQLCRSLVYTAAGEARAAGRCSYPTPGTHLAT
eukprot:1997701-Pyramimonas_sp.AAC.1